MPRYLLSLCCLLSLSSCLQGQFAPEMHTTGPELILLDSAAASRTILIDETDDYFRLVGKLDMAIQMGKEYPESTPREWVLEAYQRFLQTDVASFTPQEAKRLQGIFGRAFSLCDRLQPGSLPSPISLIKSKGKAYGAGAYFTREQAIVIPAQALEGSSDGELLQVMLHELFHVYSRFHPEKRDSLYARIGFRKVDLLRFDTVLRKRLLLNPDGVDTHWAINLALSPDSVVCAVPLTFSNRPHFHPAQPGFFSYLEFELFALASHPDGGYSVLSGPDGRSTLSQAAYASFYRQIGDNTQYVIHPDEILADNFVLLVIGQLAPDLIRDLSPEGRNLLASLKKILVDEAE